MVLGVFLVRPIPQQEQYISRSLEDGDDVQEAFLPAQGHNHSRTPLLNNNSTKDRHLCYTRTDANTDGQSSNCARAVHSIQASDQKTSTPNVHGKALLHNLDFWLLLSICSMRMLPFFHCFFFLINVLYNMDSRWDRSHMCVFNLLKYPLRLYYRLLSRYKQCWLYVTVFICL